MYKQVKTTKQITLHNDVTAKPVATLKDEYGGVCQIITDDHCYVICLKRENGKYKHTCYIFKEVFEVLKKLESPV